MKTKLTHREFRGDKFWQEVPAWKNVSEEEFADHKWQTKNSIRKPSQVKDLLGDRVKNSLIEDIEAGLAHTPMNIRMTPYVFSLIDWDNPTEDPLRKQFLPIASQFLPDHPFYLDDSLNEDVDSPVSLLTHRYPDKVLFLPLTTCPVYCSYCTRSRIIGGSTETKDKDTYGANEKRWEPVFEYLRNTKSVEDVVISGGDSYNLQPKQISYIGKTLLEIPHIRRIRYATKGIAILPMKVTSDDEWVNALSDVHTFGKERGKQVVIHTHFSSPNELSIWSKRAMERLFSIGIIVRNQAVLQTGVNNDADTQIYLNRKLSYINIQPYYVYMHDMVPGCEHFRTTLEEAVLIEKKVRGSTAGFNTPRFVCDVPGGGGKRQIESYWHYDRETGISVWTASTIKPGELFLYFDPIHKLPKTSQTRWGKPEERTKMVKDAVSSALLRRARGIAEAEIPLIKTQSLERRYGIALD